MARGSAHRYAQLVLLSPLFEGVATWLEFKAKLRAKSRRVSTSSHFFNMLSQSRLMLGQSLLDYFQTVEMGVMQVAQDYPYDIGEVCCWPC